MSGSANRRQKRMGPAPFASFEDLSDELESPEDKNAASLVRLPGIREDVTPTPSNTPLPLDQPQFVYTGISLVGAVSLAPGMAQPAGCAQLQAPATPRIDISRASSSSHHDSRDSTPERELFAAAPPAKLGLGFREEGALDLRSSTEELAFHEPAKPLDDGHHQRKDSQGSELGLLCISGRTSRLSSIGSQGSGHSRLSNASHLSVISGQSRSPSPHKMLLETSFCGAKPPKTTPKGLNAMDHGTKTEPDDDLERVLLARKQDPTQAVLAEGIESLAPVKQVEKKAPKVPASVKSDIMIRVDEPETKPKEEACKIPKKIVAQSGVEYIYIPLKGPLPKEANNVTKPVKKCREDGGETSLREHQKVRETKSASNIQTRTPTTSTPSSAPLHHRHQEPKYIRIKLKPDYMYSREDAPEHAKPDTLDLIQSVEESATVQAITPTASPKLPRANNNLLKETIGSKTPSPSLSRKSSFASLFRSKETIMSPESPTTGCRRKNTLSGVLEGRSRSRSKSRERNVPSSSESIDSKSNKSHKSVFSIFKGGKKSEGKKETPDGSSSSGDILPSIEGIAKVEFKFKDSETTKKKKYYDTPLSGESIRIPLHSPSEEQSFDVKTSSQDSQDTVIEVRKEVETVVDVIQPVAITSSNIISCSNVNSEEVQVAQLNELQEVERVEVRIETPKSNQTPIEEQVPKRQSSTSSENIIFSTKLGSNNEIFSTKLPKKSEPKNELIETKNEPKNEPKLVTITATTIALTSATLTTTISNRSFHEDKDSSESERDSEPDFSKKSDLKLDLDLLEPERKGLVLQDSYEDELPYVPTTLPQERSAAVPIVPINQRSTFEMRTCPIERPRSTTPINPSCLEDYCEDVMGSFNVESVTRTIEKLKISLPKHDSVDKTIRSPKKASNGSNWFAFAEKTTGRRSSQGEVEAGPPPLPPKGLQREWINFEEIPERRKAPKRIQTLPSRGHIDVAGCDVQDNVVYNYVNPEECKCECHEKKEKEVVVQEDELPLLDDPDDENKLDRIKVDSLGTNADRRSLVSDSSIDLSTSVDQPEANGGLELSLRTPFTSDLGVSSNRSSVVSQEEPHSPDSPNAFPKSF